MRVLQALFGLTLLTASLTSTTDTAACGGCLGAPTESTVVVGHRMILSLSAKRTTLWDQITYAGNPSSFAWVLPIRGKVEIGLSSDALFQTLDRVTAVTVSSPPLDCPVPDGCYAPRSTSVISDRRQGGLADAPSEEVGILATEVVGPYETVQLHSTDAGALKAWLGEHGYAIADDVAPIVDAYVQEGFDFLALKLVPGQGVSAMRPVRVTSEGASPALPLRMVAVGTGARTPVTLWVVGEGRYEPANAPSFTLDPAGLVWSWESSSSNYSVLRQQALDERQGEAWMIEAAQPLSSMGISSQLVSLARTDPARSGYAGSPDESAEDAADDDAEALFGALSPASTHVTRLHAQLSRKALTADLTLGASMDQSPVPRMLVAEVAIGTPPPCPAYPSCTDDGGCALTGGPSEPWSAGALAFAGALASLLRRRRRG